MSKSGKKRTTEKLEQDSSGAETVRARPIDPDAALAEENPEWAAADTAEVTSIKEVVPGENRTLVGRPTPHPNKPLDVVTVDDDEEIPESALLSFEETTARPATTEELEVESTAVEVPVSQDSAELGEEGLKTEQSVDWKQVAEDSPLMRAYSEQPTKEDRGAIKRKPKKPLSREVKDEIQRRFEEAQALLKQKRKQTGEPDLGAGLGSGDADDGASFSLDSSDEPDLGAGFSFGSPDDADGVPPAEDAATSPAGAQPSDESSPRRHSEFSQELSLSDLWEETGQGRDPSQSTAPVDVPGDARASWLEDMGGAELKRERTGNFTEGLEEIWTQFENVEDRHGAQVAADGKVVNDFSSPYRAHETLLRAIAAQDLDTFMKSFHHTVLRRMMKGASKRSETGKRRARRVMATLNDLFQDHGTPTLGRELSDSGKQRLFEYEDPSNPDNTRATYRKERSMWVLVD